MARRPVSLLMLLLLGLASEGCGLTRSTSDPGADSDGGDSGGSGGFIEGTSMDGSTIRVDENVIAYEGQYFQDGWMGLSGDSDAWTWFLLVANFVGDSPCGSGNVQLVRQPTEVFLLSDPGLGACTVTIEQAAPEIGDVIEGTFSASLSTLGGPPDRMAITDGAFSIRRVEDSP